MNLFYTPSVDSDDYFDLPEIEARHCTQVLRKRPGDVITLVDGKGGMFEAVLEDAGKKHCRVRITDRKLDYGKRPFTLHMGIAPTKNITRFEWFLEKATEIGVEAVTPLICDHSERKRIRNDRLERVMVSAMKQSQKAFLPHLNELTSFEDFVRKMKEHADFGQRFLAHCEDRPKVSLKDNYQAGKSVVILIGPEGDFSPGEIDFALAHGFEGITLGPSRLRTETAGIVACHIVELLNEFSI